MFVSRSVQCEEMHLVIRASAHAGLGCGLNMCLGVSGSLLSIPAPAEKAEVPTGLQGQIPCSLNSFPFCRFPPLQTTHIAE